MRRNRHELREEQIVAFRTKLFGLGHKLWRVKMSRAQLVSDIRDVAQWIETADGTMIDDFNSVWGGAGPDNRIQPSLAGYVV